MRKLIQNRRYVFLALLCVFTTSVSVATATKRPKVTKKIKGKRNLERAKRNLKEQGISPIFSKSEKDKKFDKKVKRMMPIIRGIFKAMKIERVRLSNGFKHKNGQYYYVELFGYQPEKVKLHLAQDAVETNDFPKSLPVHELFAKDKVSRKDVLKGMEALIEEFNDMH